MEQYEIRRCQTAEDSEKAMEILRKVLKRDIESIPKKECFLAFADEHPVASVCLEMGDEGFLRGVAVLSEYRRQGVGRALIKSIEEYLEQKQPPVRLVLHSPSHSRAFFYAMGFAEKDEAFWEYGEPVRRMVMEMTDD